MTRELMLVIRDDFDGSTDAETIEFGWRGVSYEIDLSEEHATDLEIVLAPYLEKARRPDETKTTKPRAKRRSPRDLNKIRDWWQGRTGQRPVKVTRALHQQYNDEHPGAEIPL